MDNRLVAQTIFDQIGGFAFKMMVGASHFSHTNNALKFRFELCNLANVCRITLNGLDLYDVEFFKCRPTVADCEPIKTYENIYFDQLKPVFQEFTGFCISL